MNATSGDAGTNSTSGCVKRFSVGSALARCALTALLRGAREMKDNGTFRFADDAEPFRSINSLFIN